MFIFLQVLELRFFFIILIETYSDKTNNSKMKKKNLQKEFLIKKAQLETLRKYKDYFVMVKYSDTKLVPNQAKVLGFIRGMIRNNQKNPKMKVLNKVWMKETTKKMAFLLGLGESTVKDHIKHLEEKGYLFRNNLSEYLDNTNWYWIDEEKIEKDYKDYLLKLDTELNQLSDEVKIESNSTKYSISGNDNKIEISQILANDSSEVSSTILYNNSRILNNTEYNIKEYFENDKEVNSEIIIDNELTSKNLKLDKAYCFNELKLLLPNGWYDFLIKNGEEKTLVKYYNYVEHLNDEELIQILKYFERILE